MEAMSSSPDNPDFGPLRESKTETIERLIGVFEARLNAGVLEGDRYDELLEEIISTIGLDDTTAPYTLQAFGHHIPVYGGDIDPSLEIIDCSEVYFDDILVKPVDGVERVGIHYKAIEAGDVEWYFVPPAGVMSTNIYSEMIDPDDNLHPVLRSIRKLADIALDKIEDSPFYAADAAYQRTVMRDIAKELYCDLAAEYDADVVVSIVTNTYYTLPDPITAELDWRQCKVVRDDQVPSFTLEGSVTEVVYLEMLYGEPTIIKSAADFEFGDGLPCVILSNLANNAVYYVPAVSIQAFYSDEDIV